MDTTETANFHYHIIKCVNAILRSNPAFDSAVGRLNFVTGGLAYEEFDDVKEAISKLEQDLNLLDRIERDNKDLLRVPPFEGAKYTEESILLSSLVTIRYFIIEELNKLDGRLQGTSEMIDNPALRPDRREHIRAVEKSLNEIIKDLEADNSPYGEGDRVTLISLLRQVNVMLGSGVKNTPGKVEPKVILNATKMAAGVAAVAGVSDNVSRICKLAYALINWMFGNGSPPTS